MKKKLIKWLFICGGVILVLFSFWAINPIAFRPAIYNYDIPPLVPPTFAFLLPLEIEVSLRGLIFFFDLAFIHCFFLTRTRNERLRAIITVIMIFVYLSLLGFWSNSWGVEGSWLDTHNPYDGYVYEHTEQWQSQGNDIPELEGFLARYETATSYLKNDLEQQLHGNFITREITVTDIAGDPTLEYGYVAYLTGEETIKLPSGEVEKIELCFPVSETAAVSLEKGQKIVVRGKINSTVFNLHNGYYGFGLRGATVSVSANDGTSFRYVY